MNNLKEINLNFSIINLRFNFNNNLSNNIVGFKL